jgi:exonuclease VII small subunit
MNNPKRTEKEKALEELYRAIEHLEKGEKE